jgi:uncharacterized damage-inducible protein DinB
MKMNRIVLAALVCFATSAFGQEAKGVHADLLKNLDDTQKKLVSLAEAVPADKYTWRPAEGVRSISEVYMHIAGANYMIPAGMGVAPPPGLSPDMEKKVTDKAKVVEQLKQSFEHLRKALEGASELERLQSFLAVTRPTGPCKYSSSRTFMSTLDRRLLTRG